jgi:hypothetical protein
MTQPSPQQLDEYLSRITNPAAIEALSQGTGISGKEIAATLSVFAAEARFGYRMIAPRLQQGSRILEVGSGLGLLSGYLKSLGARPDSVWTAWGFEIGALRSPWRALLCCERCR